MRREEPQHLDLGVDARLQPPVALEDHAIVEHDGGVALLVAGGPRPVGQRIEPIRPDGASELHARRFAERRRRANVRKDDTKVTRVVERLVQLLVPGPPNRRFSRATGLTLAHHELVQLMMAAVETDLDQCDRKRRIVADRHHLHDRRLRDRVLARAVPAAVGDERGEGVLVQVA